MLETFFLLSLAITFLLVVFLVYHFKNRISTLEHKCDTMFEIINGIASELGHVRNILQINNTNLPVMPEINNNQHRISVSLSDDGHDLTDSESEYETDSDDDDDDDDHDRYLLDELPVFTLKRPFESRDEIRRLNLFEPRWLRMLDEIARRNDGSLVGAKLGVVLAQNRLYTPENFDDVGDDDFDDTSKSNENETRNKRVARIVFDPFVQRAKVVDAKESSRPVTGARKVEVFVALDSEANDDFIGEFREAPGQRGYMLASKKTPTGDRGEPTKNEARDEKEANDGSGRVVKCVVVCGKLHVRGVVGRLRMHLDNDDSVSSSDNSSDSGGVVVTM